jgi:RNA-dependent RNA polymerase
MDPSRLDQDLIDSTLVFNSRNPTSSTLGREPIQHSEQKSETSSNSEESFNSCTMYRGNQRGGRGGYRAGRGSNRTYSNSSGSSNGQYNPNRPTLKPTSNSQSTLALNTRIATPEQLVDPPARVDSPVTPIKQLSSFDLNGYSINETYIAKNTTGSTPPTARSPITSPPRQVTRASPRYGGDRPRYNPADQRNSQRPVLRGGSQNWAYNQEGKIRLSGIPKNCWTKDVFHAMSAFGTVFRVDMVSGSQHNTAYVVFR